MAAGIAHVGVAAGIAGAGVVEPERPIARRGQLIGQQPQEQCDRSASCISPGQISTATSPAALPPLSALPPPSRGACSHPKQPSNVTGVIN